MCPLMRTASTKTAPHQGMLRSSVKSSDNATAVPDADGDAVWSHSGQSEAEATDSTHRRPGLSTLRRTRLTGGTSPGTIGGVPDRSAGRI